MSTRHLPITLATLALAPLPALGQGTIAGCANEIPIGQVAVDELRHDDGGGPDFLVAADFSASQQREIVHANRYVNPGTFLITHICIHTINPDPMLPGVQQMQLFIAHGDDGSHNDVRPGSSVWSSNEEIEVGWQLVEVNPPVAAHSVTWIGAKFWSANAGQEHLGVNTASDYMPDGVTPTPSQAFVGIINMVGGQDLWTDYEDIGPFSGYRPIIRGLTIDDADCSSADIVVTNAQDLETTEGGGTAQFAVSLTGPLPTHNVVVIVGSSNEFEGVANTIGLIFTPANAGVPQIVTITGQDDLLPDGDVDYEITLLASSLDPCYHQLQAPPIPVVNRDDETASCPEDITGDGLVDVDDLLQVLLHWGGIEASTDVNQDGMTDVDDLLLVLFAWGPC